MSSWIEHVKQYAKTNNISFKDALGKAKETYGGSAKSGYIKKLIKKGEFDINKMKSTPSKSLKKTDLEQQLKELAKNYYIEVDSNIIKSAATGRRAITRKYGSASEYYKKYNELKKQLEDITKTPYQDLKLEAEVKKETKKELNKMKENDKQQIEIKNETSFEIPKRKKIKSPLL